MPGTCVRSISHSLSTKRVLAFRRITCLSRSSSSSKPRAGLIVRENAVLLPGSSSGHSGPRPRWHHQIRSIASMSSAADEQPEEAVPEEKKSALPPLSAHEFKQYNRLAEHMNYFVRATSPFPGASAHPADTHLSTNTSGRHGRCSTTRPPVVADRRACQSNSTLTQASPSSRTLRHTTASRSRISFPYCELACKAPLKGSFQLWSNADCTG